MRCFHVTVSQVRTRFQKETEVTNREIVSRVIFHSVFRFADPANVGKSLLDGNKDHLLKQARSELVKQSKSFSNKLMLKTPITDMLNQGNA